MDFKLGSLRSFNVFFISIFFFFSIIEGDEQILIAKFIS